MEQVVKERSFRLQKRDIGILKYIFENKFSTSNQIHGEFWKSKLETKTHLRRIRDLVHQGYLDSLVGDGGSRLGFVITSKGRLLLSKYNPSKSIISYSRTVYKSTYEHDKILIDLRKLFILSPIVSEFRTEHQVRAQLAKKHGGEEKIDTGYKVPDALSRMKTLKKDLLVALELEISSKSKERYRKIMRQLSLNLDFQLIFFVVSSRNLIEKLKQTLDEIRAKDPIVRAWNVKPGFYFCELEDILKHGLDAKFSGEEQMFSLNELAERSANKAA